MSQQIKKSYFWIPLIVALTFIGGLFVGNKVLTPAHRYAGDANSKLSEILDYVSTTYVDVIDTDSLLESLFPDMLSSLDPHSVYIPAEDLQAVNEELEGSFSGIGISFNTLSDTITVVEVISGGPSEAVGLMPGDRIVNINDTLVAGQGWSTEKIMSHLRGPEGTIVKVGIKRNSSPDILDFDITRGQIPVTSIDAAYMIQDKTGYIKVNKFGTTTYDEFIDEAFSLYDNGARKFIIDLRGNGGGYMEMAILMANEFLENGLPIVSTKGRTPESVSEFSSDGGGYLKDVEVAVIIDEYSASASEIFAGAMQDNDRGLVVGRRSFGKGLVQRQFDLADGSAIRLTIARYYTPSGRCIQKTYEHGGQKAYEDDILERIDRGEIYSADSIKLDRSITYYTSTGRQVFGGGGIMPDIFVPNDSTGVTSYYMNVINKGILQRFAFDYNDHNRSRLSKARNVNELLSLLPSDAALLEQFAKYAEKEGVPQRWYYINLSADLIVNQLKALIARNALGTSAYYMVDNRYDPTVKNALEALKKGKARFPLKP